LGRYEDVIAGVRASECLKLPSDDPAVGGQPRPPPATDLTRRSNPKIVKTGVVGVDTGEFDVFVAPDHVGERGCFYRPVVVGSVELGGKS
jgi:hypothetical protein